MSSIVIRRLSLCSKAILLDNMESFGYNIFGYANI